MRLELENVGGSTIATSQRRPARRASTRNSRTSATTISPVSWLSSRFARAHSVYVFERSTLVVCHAARAAAWTLNAPVYAKRLSSDLRRLGRDPRARDPVIEEQAGVDVVAEVDAKR